jgi:hypothetical protein
MTNPEFFFDDRDSSDYRLFGVRHLILPAGTAPPVPARLAMRSGSYSLWTLDGAGYVQAAEICIVGGEVRLPTLSHQPSAGTVGAQRAGARRR